MELGSSQGPEHEVDIEMESADNLEYHQEHPRHARKRPRLADSMDQRASRSPTPVTLRTDANAYSATKPAVIRNTPPPPLSPSITLMNPNLRESYEMFFEVQRLKKETERLEIFLQEHLRMSSEESRRLERRLEVLERSNLPDTKSSHIGVTQQTTHDDTAPGSGPRRLNEASRSILEETREPNKVTTPQPLQPLQSSPLTDSMMRRLDVPVRDSAVRLKVASLLDQIYELVKSDLITFEPPTPSPVISEQPELAESDKILVEDSSPSGALETSSTDDSFSISHSSFATPISRDTTPSEIASSPRIKPASTLTPQIPAERKPIPVLNPRPANTSPIFLHPPFTTLPDSHHYPESLSYDVMAANSDWFFDPVDFVSTGSSIPGAIPYPPQLAPPFTKHHTTSSAKFAESAIGSTCLRCTFCRRTYSGPDAGDMWSKHVLEVHNVAVAPVCKAFKNSSKRQADYNSVQKHSLDTPARDELHSDIIDPSIPGNTSL